MELSSAIRGAWSEEERGEERGIKEDRRGRGEGGEEGTLIDGRIDEKSGVSLGTGGEGVAGGERGPI